MLGLESVSTHCTARAFSIYGRALDIAFIFECFESIFRKLIGGDRIQTEAPQNEVTKRNCYETIRGLRALLFGYRRMVSRSCRCYLGLPA